MLSSHPFSPPLFSSRPRRKAAESACKGTAPTLSSSSVLPTPEPSYLLSTFGKVCRRGCCHLPNPLCGIGSLAEGSSDLCRFFSLLSRLYFFSFFNTSEAILALELLDCGIDL